MTDLAPDLWPKINVGSNHSSGRRAGPSSCGKRGYTKVEAQTALNARLAGRGAPDELRIYQCPGCNRWHLTHKEHHDSE